MTKQEYKDLLESDYWRGFSYSIIKERNFTCEDCGAYYPNERNKLQVHHLVYRDINPWSYAPEEMVVLCRECHEKRHGIVHTPDTSSVIEEKDGVLIGQDANFWDVFANKLRLLREKLSSNNSQKYKVRRYNGRMYQRHRRKKTILHVFLFFVILYLALSFLSVTRRDDKKSMNNEHEYKTLEKKSYQKTKRKKKSETPKEIDPFQEIVEPDNLEPEIDVEQEEVVNIQESQNPTVEEQTFE